MIAYLEGVWVFGVWVFGVWLFEVWVFGVWLFEVWVFGVWVFGVWGPRSEFSGSEFSWHPVLHLIADLHRENHIDDMTKKWLWQTPNPPRMPEFYTLTKIHKPTITARPIILGCDGGKCVCIVFRCVDKCFTGRAGHCLECIKIRNARSDRPHWFPSWVKTCIQDFIVLLSQAYALAS